MNHNCDMCGEPIKKVGKLLKVGSLMLCKSCRIKQKFSRLRIGLKERVTRRK
jgi:ribosome-binding protein aMBF1 (putative translation factor)